MKFSRQLESMGTTSQGYFPDRLLPMEDYIFKSPASARIIVQEKFYGTERKKFSLGEDVKEQGNILA
jgi:hypothetical protein